MQKTIQGGSFRKLTTHEFFQAVKKTIRLLHSTSKESVFCLGCQLFGKGKSQLEKEYVCREGQHLSHILSEHEESEMHLNNSAKYSKLKFSLEKDKTDEAAEHKLCENKRNDGVLLCT